MAANPKVHKHILFSAIAPDTAKNLLEEIRALESPDMTQISYSFHSYTTTELKELKAKIMAINDRLQENIYNRTSRGKAVSRARYARERAKTAAKRREKVDAEVDKFTK